MKNDTIIVERTYNAPVERVWKAITDKDQMKQWYFDLKEFKAEVGFKFTFYGGDEKTQYLHICKITEVIPDRKLTHTWQYEHIAAVSYVTFELFPEGTQTRLRLTHTGVGQFPSDKDPNFAPASFEKGWTMIIGTSLKNFVEK